MGQRYKGLKGKYWALFSEYVRRRDFIRFGTCILYPAANECQIGESLMQVTLSPQAAADLLKTNVNGECPCDNAFMARTVDAGAITASPL